MPSSAEGAAVTAEAQPFSYRTGAAGPAIARAVAVEAPVEFVLGGSPFAVMMATPRELDDFAYGFLFTEGIVEQPGDIRSIETSQNESRLATRDRADRREAEDAPGAQARDQRTFGLRSLRRRGPSEVSPSPPAGRRPRRRSPRPQSARRSPNSKDVSRSTP